MSLGKRTSYITVFSVLAFVATFCWPAVAQFQGNPPFLATPGPGVTFAMTGDFRNLGRQDIVVSNSQVQGGSGSGNSISVFWSNGDGTYAAPMTYTVDSIPLGIAVADFNGDGYADIAVANAAGNTNNPNGTISILLNQKDGTFKLTKTISSSLFANPTGIVAAKFTSSGHYDLAVTNSNLVSGSGANSNVSILLGDGTGNFAGPVNYPVGPNPLGEAVADLDGDGHADLIVANSAMRASTPGNTLTVLFGKGDGTFPTINTLTTTGSDPFYVVTGDFNKDNHPDIAVLDSGANNSSHNRVGADIEIFMNNANALGTFSSPTVLNTPDQPKMSLLAEDFDKDGNLDLAASSENGLLLYFGKGDGTFLPAVQYALGRTSFLAAGDLNGDGFPDIVAPSNKSNEVWLILNNGDGSLPLPRAYPVGNDPASIALADFNGDGAPDIATGNRNYNNTGATVNVLKNNGDGTFTAGPAISTTGATGVSAIATGTFDLKNNFNQDIVALGENCGSGSCSSGQYTVILGNGDGTFNPNLVTVSNSNGTNTCVPFTLASGFLNSDIYPDLVMSNFVCANALVDTVTGNGDGTFNNAITAVGNQGSNVTSIALADLDGKNGSDIVAASNLFNCGGGCTGTEKVAVMLNNGSGAFLSETDLGGVTQGTHPYAVAAGDLRNTGKPDLVVVNVGDPTFGVTTNPSTFTVFLNNGSGGFATGKSYALGTGNNGFQPQAVALADVNGDGKLDAVVGDVGQNCPSTKNNCNAAPGDVMVLLGNGDGTFQTPIVYSTVQRASAVTLGDLNGDGAPDLVVANQNEPGTVVVMLNTGGTKMILTTSGTPSSYGQSVTFTASVTAGVKGSGTPTGSVLFCDGAVSGAACTGTSLGSAALNGSGVASVTTSTLGIGIHLITAIYTPANGSSFYPNKSKVLSQFVNPASSTTTITMASANPSTAGTAVTFTAMVTSSGGTPAGTVTFSATGPATVTSSTGNALSAGSATGSLTFTVAGTYSVTASFISTDNNISSSTSAAWTQLVNCTTCAMTTTTIQMAVLPVDPGEHANTVQLKQTATLTVTVTNDSATTAPTGSVQLTDNGTNLGSAQTLNPGPGNSSTATFTVRGLALGTHNIVATYGGVQPTFGQSFGSVAMQFSPKPH